MCGRKGTCVLHRLSSYRKLNCITLFVLEAVKRLSDLLKYVSSFSILSHCNARVIVGFEKQSDISFLCMLPVAVARSSSDGVVIRYALPVLRMTSGFHTVRSIGGRTRRRVLARRLPLAERRPLLVGRSASSQAVLLPRRPRTRVVPVQWFFSQLGVVSMHT